MDSQSSSFFHTFILYTNIGVCIFIVLSFLYFHFTWRNGRNRLPDRPRFSQASTFWNELNSTSTTNRLMTNNNNRNLEEEAKLLRISNKLIDDSESSAGEDSI
uniref:Candidate secreted effector n=1 Tax=Meloidogyne incognita TaxID=6306 RepID=A0A914NDY7_MELIC